MPKLIDIVIPATGESVTSGVVAKWSKPDGAAVKRDETVLELETDKITVEVAAPAAGKLKHSAKVGDTVAVGGVVGQIEEGAAGETAAPAPAPAAPAPAASTPAAPVPAPASIQPEPKSAPVSASNGQPADARATPLAKKMADEHGIDVAALAGSGPGGKVREQDVLAAVQARQAAPAATATATAPAPRPASPAPAAAGSRRERMSPLRQRIAQRLVEAQSNAAMLTTFNEVDMSAIMALRTRYKEEFEKKNAVGLGFMSFFVKATALALQKMPVVNASIVSGTAGEIEVEYHEACHISVAVSTPKGLTVPVLRNCQSLSFSQIEAGIRDLAAKARDGKLALDDLQGGTFTITNGGVFGSLLSTPILNAPQTAILGMHTIKNRPVENPDKPGEIVLRPMMYLAMSYDHRLLDGQEAVTFLISIKNALERPERMLLAI